MKQRLGIAQALINRPKLLICDEPTSALDPAGRKEIIEILRSLREHTTVVFSTHVLSDVERICDEIGLLHGGKMALEGRLDEIRRLRKASGFDIEFQTESDRDRFSRLMPAGEAADRTRLLFPTGTEKEMSSAMKLLHDGDICPVRIELREPSLEALFIEEAKK